MHTTPSPLAGQTVKVNPKGEHQLLVSGAEYRVEDYWDRVTGTSWMFSDGNIAALNYAMRSAGQLPLDDEVLYGKIDGLGYLVHVSEVDSGSG